jgi:hypothetical protein
LGSHGQLDYCDLAYAGRGGNSAGLVYSSDVTIRNCRIHHNAYRAVHLEGAGLSPAIEDTRIESNGEIAVYQTTIDMTPTYRPRLPAMAPTRSSSRAPRSTGRSRR